MNTIELNALAQRVHKLNEKWWQHPVTKERIERNKGELLMLVITELVEACEGERKDLMDDKLPHRKMAEVEMADAAIRLLDFAAGQGIHLIYQENLKGCTENKGSSLFSICSGIVVIGQPKLAKLFPNNGIGTCIAMIEDYCSKFGYDLYGALEEKLAYNATRVDHTHEARLQAEGKKW